jgi:hypothetical protein
MVSSHLCQDTVSCHPYPCLVPYHLSTEAYAINNMHSWCHVKHVHWAIHPCCYRCYTIREKCLLIWCIKSCHPSTWHHAMGSSTLYDLIHVHALYVVIHIHCTWDLPRYMIWSMYMGLSTSYLCIWDHVYYMVWSMYIHDFMSCIIRVSHVIYFYYQFLQEKNDVLYSLMLCVL